MNFCACATTHREEAVDKGGDAGLGVGLLHHRVPALHLVDQHHRRETEACTETARKQKTADVNRAAGWVLGGRWWVRGAGLVVCLGG